MYATKDVERAIRTHSGSVLTSHAAQEAVFTLLISLLGLSLTTSVLFIRSNPLLYFGAVLAAGAVFVIAAGMLSRWLRKYSRRRSRHGTLARGQVPALFAFLVLLLQMAMAVAAFALTSLHWRGF